MTLYHAAEYEIPVGKVSFSLPSKLILSLHCNTSVCTWYLMFLISFKFTLQPVTLSENLEAILLSMCEESSQLRIRLSKVLEVWQPFFS